MKHCRTLALWSTLAASAACLTVSCANILGIERARCDERFLGCPGHTADAALSTASATGHDHEVPTASPGDAQVPSADAQGVGDGGASTSGCTSYCDTILEACSALPQYASREACLAVCTTTFGLSTDTSSAGDNLTCRQEQAQLAKDFGGEDGCLEAGSTGGGVCGGDICQNYCRALAQVCPEQAATLSNCEEECAALPRTGEPFAAPQPGSFTLECRAYHLQLATVQRSPHCLHAIGSGPSADNRPCAAPN